jgi:hypothetical protein
MNFREQGWEPLPGLATDKFVIRPLLISDAALDYDAVIESRDDLRIWEQSGWPADDFTLGQNLIDLRRHEDDAERGTGYTYTVMKADETECLGCVYIYTPAVRWIARMQVTALTDDRWNDVDAITSFWVRTSRLGDGMESALLSALTTWLVSDWPFRRNLFSCAEPLSRQISVLETAGLNRRFALHDPTLDANFLAFA